VNYVELIQGQAEHVFADKEKAAAWLNKPQTAFSGMLSPQAVKLGTYQSRMHSENHQGYIS
jgi:hypothetical protein